MLICGVKASHDGAVALVENGRLAFSIEVEKIQNGTRYSTLGDLDRITEILRGEGISPGDVDQFVVDGWWAIPGAGEPAVRISRSGIPALLPVAPYVDGASSTDVLARFGFPDISLIPGSRRRGYVSYHHAANHALGAYCTSPFAERGEDSLVLVWDGGMVPRLYHVRAAEAAVRLVAPLMPVVGNIFPDFCQSFGPFRRDTAGLDADAYMRYHLEIAGKAMAYAGLGSVSEDRFGVFDRLLGEFSGIKHDNARLLGEKVATNREEIMPGMSDADIIATFQDYLGRKISRALSRVTRQRYPGQAMNLCLGGGCALNIKWNSRIRASGVFADIWVPPFPNDSGAAIGTACCEMFAEGRVLSLGWDVYRGPRTGPARLREGWAARPCDERGVAEILHREGEPVVVLGGRAELGPRALGNRSILAPAVSPGMKDRLNGIKGRAHYRPVAPVCLESRAAAVFDPGCRDPYMLFEHRIRPGWAARIPAVAHLDGTARLQTISPSARSPAAVILAEYERLSSIPVLCNTSANLAGHGFFPDAGSAMDWGLARYVWSDGTLYTRLSQPPHEPKGLSDAR